MQASTRSASIVTLAMIIAAGLANGVTPANAASPIAACDLLTHQDAVAALGEAVAGPNSKSGMSMGPGATASSCGYTGTGYHSIDLTLIQMSPDQVAIYRSLCAEKKMDGLSDLGEMACWYDDDHDELQVLKGTTVFTIELRGLKNPTEAIKAVAKSASTRLK